MRTNEWVSERYIEILRYMISAAQNTPRSMYWFVTDSVIYFHGKTKRLHKQVTNVVDRQQQKIKQKMKFVVILKFVLYSICCRSQYDRFSWRMCVPMHWEISIWNDVKTGPRKNRPTEEVNTQGNSRKMIMTSSLRIAHSLFSLSFYLPS